jgi:hypothetical protein
LGLANPNPNQSTVIPDEAAVLTTYYLLLTTYYVLRTVIPEEAAVGEHAILKPAVAASSSPRGDG